MDPILAGIVVFEAGVAVGVMLGGKEKPKPRSAPMRPAPRPPAPRAGPSRPAPRALPPAPRAGPSKPAPQPRPAPKPRNNNVREYIKTEKVTTVNGVKRASKVLSVTELSRKGRS